MDIASRRATFRRLHEKGCFVIPNPWDVGSAKALASLGFKALATTSSGFAFTKGLADEHLTRDIVLRHCREMAAATGLPLNADFQSGYAADPEGVAESVRQCVETGVSGLSIEDSTGDATNPLFDLDVALPRLKAARAAIDASGQDVMLTARAECYLVGHPNPLEESVTRLKAYAEAGADVLFAPGPRTPSDIEAIVKAVAPKPVNVIMHLDAGLTVADLASVGVRRISVGSALARSAWGGFIRAARLIASDGSFAGFQDAIPFPELNGMFA